MLSLKCHNLIVFSCLISSVTVLITQPIAAQITLDNTPGLLIAQSRRTFKCGGVRDVLSDGKAKLTPSVSGAIVRGTSCFIPVSAGKCIAFDNGAPVNFNDSPSPFMKCSRGWPRVVTDEATGKRYYYLEAVGFDSELILEVN